VKKIVKKTKNTKVKKPKLLSKKESKVIEKTLNVEPKMHTEKKVEIVPDKLGDLTFKKNKLSGYDILNKDKKVVAEMMPPMYVGKYFLPCWAVWKQTIENKSVLDEVFANLPAALTYIQKKYSKK